jgi:hypothetical protein
VLMHSIVFVVGFCIASGFCPKSLAESIHGIVSFEKIPSHLGQAVEEIRVRPLTGNRFSSTVSHAKGLPIETSLMIRESLATLQAGDFVVLSGQYHDHDRNGTVDSIFVNGIESVGLKRLIRAWKSKKWDVMQFENFSRMILYRPESTAGAAVPLRFQKLKELNYTLAPDQGSDYSILMVETPPSLPTSAVPSRPAHPVFAGKLTVEKDSLRIELFDTKSGLTAEVYSLSPL